MKSKVERPWGYFKVLMETNFSKVKLIYDFKNYIPEFSSFLIDQANVAVIPGSAFGAEGSIRISYATSMELLKESIARIKSSIE